VNQVKAKQRSNQNQSGPESNFQKQNISQSN
jgi:hypothetical protein